ncbi:MAG: DUF6789 family protein [Gemmatimonadota bacterium]
MNTRRAIVAGLIATGVMTALLLIEPAIGLPDIAVGQILSSSLGVVSAYLDFGPAIGWLIHFLFGAALGVLYAGIVLRHLLGEPVLRGMQYGVAVFVMAQVLFMPLVGAGFFSNGQFSLLLGSLLGHLLYGAVLGWIYDTGMRPEANPSDLRVATPGA